MAPHLSFLGAARTVTGSCHLLEYESRRVLIDCGLFQGSKSLRELNYSAFPFDPASIDVVLMTHAHIDHSGLLPKLVRDGYRGRILATEATRDLLAYMLPDSGYIQEAEVQHLNRRRTQRGEAPVPAIYTRAIAENTLRQIDSVPFGEWVRPQPGLRARFWNAGHILGAASIEIEIATGRGGRSLRMLFSGDLGGADRPLHKPAEGPSDLDYVIVEGTYGDVERRRITPEQRRNELAAEVKAALAKGGNLLIPVFAIERTQELLLDLGLLVQSGTLPKVPIFLDSPLAVRATEVFARHAGELGGEPRSSLPFTQTNFHFIDDVAASKQLNLIRSGAIIMAASGMCDAGRIRHHLKHNLWREDATVLLVGYQAPGTLGYLLRSGVPAVRIHGEEIKVRARIRHLDTYSAHADRADLVSWVSARMPVRSAILLTHGEPDALAALQAELAYRLEQAPPILVPTLGAQLHLDGGAPELIETNRRLSREKDIARDWHNDYAALLLDISEKLRRCPSAAARRQLLARLREAVAVEPPGSPIREN